jgi:hypothetical protein
MRGLACAMAALALGTARAELPNAIAVVDDLGDRVMLFSIVDGRYMGDLLAAGEGQLASPVDCQAVRNVRIGNVTHAWVVLISDPRQMRIVAYNALTGAFLGPIASGVEPRGLALGGDGRLLVATDATGVRGFATNGATPATIVTPEVVLGPNDAWDVLYRPQSPSGTPDLLVADATLDAILRFSPTGQRLGVFARRPEFRFVEQLGERANGNVLAADALGNALHEFRADGYWLRALPVIRPRGVVELRNGNLLVSCEAGVLELDGARGALLNVRMPGYPVSAPRYITRLRYSTSVLLGDLNGDGAADYFDIDPFVLALLDRPSYTSAHPEIDPVAAGDIDGDGELSFSDIDAFVDLLLR